MRTEPLDLDRGCLARLLEREWAISSASLEYHPVGFGSHHWEASDARGARWFVTADLLTRSHVAPDLDAALAGLERAFRTAAVLRHAAGLEFVVASLTDRRGGYTNRLGDYAVTVFPFLADVAAATAEDDLRVLRILGRLHGATSVVPPELLRREDFELPHRHALVKALDDLDRPWTTGPFGEPARELLSQTAEALAERLESYHKLAEAVARSSESWVLTHGEPKSSNILRDRDGSLALVDWDTVKLAPRERDLWLVLGPNAPGWSHYVSTAGACDLDEQALRLYRVRWALADVAEFVNIFRRAHEETEDTAAAWGYLQETIG